MAETEKGKALFGALDLDQWLAHWEGQPVFSVTSWLLPFNLFFCEVDSPPEDSRKHML